MKTMTFLHYDYANNIIKIFGFSSIIDYQTKIQYSKLVKNEKEICEKINEKMNILKENFLLNEFDLGRIKYSLINIDQAIGFFKKLLNYLSISIECFREKKDIVMCLKPINNIYIEYINMTEIQQKQKVLNTNDNTKTNSIVSTVSYCELENNQEKNYIFNTNLKVSCGNLQLDYIKIKRVNDNVKLNIGTIITISYLCYEKKSYEYIVNEKSIFEKDYLLINFTQPISGHICINVYNSENDFRRYLNQIIIKTTKENKIKLNCSLKCFTIDTILKNQKTTSYSKEYLFNEIFNLYDIMDDFDYYENFEISYYEKQQNNNIIFDFIIGNSLFNTINLIENKNINYDVNFLSNNWYNYHEFIIKPNLIHNYKIKITGFKFLSNMDKYKKNNIEFMCVNKIIRISSKMIGFTNINADNDWFKYFTKYITDSYKKSEEILFDAKNYSIDVYDNNFNNIEFTDDFKIDLIVKNNYSFNYYNKFKFDNCIFINKNKIEFNYLIHARISENIRLIKSIEIINNYKNLFDIELFLTVDKNIKSSSIGIINKKNNNLILNKNIIGNIHNEIQVKAIIELKNLNDFIENTLYFKTCLINIKNIT
jgi:hypothetical protein